MNNPENQLEIGRGFRILYIIAIIALLFSGFGQMPIFKRYYLTSIPGLGWSGNFHITLIIHYLAASLFMGLSVYYIIIKAAGKNLWPLPSKRAWLLFVTLLTLVLTGIVLAARNISGIVFPSGFLVAVSLIHVAGTMAFIILTVSRVRFSRSKVKETGRANGSPGHVLS